MHVLLYGASGMVGSGALDTALADARVERVTGVGRRPLGRSHPRLGEIVVPDLFDVDAVAARFDPAGYDGVLWGLGVSSLGMAPAEYERLTHALTLAHAEALARHSPQAVFVYVSGAGTDASERGRVRWARVKGRTENALRRLPFRAVYAVRPGFILATNGTGPRLAWMRRLYRVLGPFFALLRRVAPGRVTTTASLGRAMLAAVAAGPPGGMLEVPALNRLGHA